MLFKARGKAPFTIHLTYPVEEIDPAREDDWNKEREKEKTRLAEGRTTKEPRAKWSPGKQSLAAFLKKTKLARGQAIVNVEPDKAHVIDFAVARGTTIGEMSLIDSARRSATIVADESVVCYELSQAAFSKMLAEHPPMVPLVPPGDGGLCLGQLAIAAAQCRSGFLA
jgi:hypothetical protein